MGQSAPTCKQGSSEDCYTVKHNGAEHKGRSPQRDRPRQLHVPLSQEAEIGCRLHFNVGGGCPGRGTQC